MLAVPGSVDQRPKQAALATIEQQKFRVPLHADQKRPAGILDGLHDAVQVAAADLQVGENTLEFRQNLSDNYTWGVTDILIDDDPFGLA